MRHRNVLLPLLAATAAGGLALTGAPAASAGAHNDRGPTVVGPYKHLVVIYEENHSFDNLYGTWGASRSAGRRARRRRRRRTTQQVAQDGTPYRCLLQDDVNLTSPDPLPTTCTTRRTACPQRLPQRAVHASTTTSSRRTRPARRPASSPPTACSRARAQPGGCTRDLVHRFYQEQYQLNGGRQNRYVTGSDAVGLTMGHYDTKQLPIYRYLHSKRRAELRDRRPVLPGGVRRLVPQPPVADGRTCAGGHRRRDRWARRRPALGRRHQRLPERDLPALQADDPVKDAPLTQACDLPTTNPTGGVRRLRREHDPAGATRRTAAAPSCR